MGSPVESTYQGYISSTHDALLIFECVRRGIMPKVTRRLRDDERRLVRSGQVFVFDEKESGIKRWTDGLLWSPSRILWNFLVYRQVEKRQPTRPVSTHQAELVHESHYPQALEDSKFFALGTEAGSSTQFAPPLPSMNASTSAPVLEPPNAHLSLATWEPQISKSNSGTSPRGRSASSAADTFPVWQASSTLVDVPELQTTPADIKTQREANSERNLVGSLTSSYPFAKDGLCKKTISIQLEDSTQHLISYYKLEDVRSGRLRTPSSLPEIASLSISPIFLTKTVFRFPPVVTVGPDGVPRFRADETHELSPRRHDQESSGEGTSSGSDTIPRRARAAAVQDARQRFGGGNGGVPLLSASQSLSALSQAQAFPQQPTLARPAPMPHEIGGTGILPRSRRASDAATRLARGRFEPYPKAQQSASPALAAPSYTYPSVASQNIAGPSDASSFPTSPNSSPNTPFNQQTATTPSYFNTFQLQGQHNTMQDQAQVELQRQLQRTSSTMTAAEQQNQHDMVQIGSMAVKDLTSTCHSTSHVRQFALPRGAPHQQQQLARQQTAFRLEGNATHQMQQQQQQQQQQRYDLISGMPGSNDPMQSQRRTQMVRPVSDHGRMHLDSTQENLRRAVASSGWDPLPPSSYQGSVASTINVARQAGSADLERGQSGSRPHTASSFMSESPNEFVPSGMQNTPETWIPPADPTGFTHSLPTAGSRPLASDQADSRLQASTQSQMNALGTFDMTNNTPQQTAESFGDTSSSGWVSGGHGDNSFLQQWASPGFGNTSSTSSGLTPSGHMGPFPESANAMPFGAMALAQQGGPILSPDQQAAFFAPQASGMPAPFASGVSPEWERGTGPSQGPSPPPPGSLPPHFSLGNEPVQSRPPITAGGRPGASASPGNSTRPKSRGHRRSPSKSSSVTNMESIFLQRPPRKG